MITERLTTELLTDPSRWRMLLRVEPGRMHATLRPIDEAAETIEAEFDLGGDMLAMLEECVYANPLILSQFRDTTIYYRTGSFMIVPPEAAQAPLMKMLGGDELRHELLVSEIDGNNSLVSVVDSGIVNFLRRTFGSAKIEHPLAASVRFFATKSRMGNSGKLFVEVGDSRLNMAGFGAPGLLAATSRALDENSTYYILATMRTAGLDPAEDEILITGDAELRSSLMEQLRDYAVSVMPMISLPV